MKTVLTQTTTLEQKLLNSDNSAVNQENQNVADFAINPESFDDTELDLEKIMFEEFAKGLPSDIPMADF
ncbi:MAG: hypothetical protein MET45_11835 [Nostoc sp. LLA-1]|nr:hypothetical protein [Cyanocohniella sp. LLY]